MHKRKESEKQSGNYELNKILFTKEMKKDYTILCPQMAPIHFEIFEQVLNSEGYKVKLLRECSAKTVDVGLKYVNNDACYPSILTTGQLLEALESGEYDINKTAVMISQTGGGCRATNYIGFIRKALRDAGYDEVPVISFNFAGLEKNPGFKITLQALIKLVKAVMYGDLLQTLLHKNRPYEIEIGETERVYEKWLEKCKTLAVKSTRKEFTDSIYDMVADFEDIKLDMSIQKPKVGIVGEILVKYHPFGNNYAETLLEKEGAEVVIPELMGFVKYVLMNKIKSTELLKTNKTSATLNKIILNVINFLEKDYRTALSNSKKGYILPCNIEYLAEKVEEILSTGNQTGEGWLLTAEMIELVENGVSNIICVQPFACLPNHVVGKGVIKTIRKKFPEANISPVDYDPGASESNQINRIKLMMTVAKDNLKQKKEKQKKQEEKETVTNVN